MEIERYRRDLVYVIMEAEESQDLHSVGRPGELMVQF